MGSGIGALLLSSAVIGFSAIYGCSGGTTGPAPETTGESQAASPTDPPGSLRVDGRLFLPVADDYMPPPAPLGRLKDLSIDEIAQAMSPILGSQGQRYRAAELNYELAQAIKSDQVLGNLVNGALPGAVPTGDNLAPEAYLFNPSNPGNPQNTDYRTEDGTSYPYSALVYVQGPTGIASGTYIGPNEDTLLTAAHVVRLNGVSNSPLKFTPGAIGVNGTVTIAPYGQYTSGCYYWWYPSAWDSLVSGGCPSPGGDEWGNGCSQYDVAVVDFRPCGNPTISHSGTMGVSINQSTFPGSGSSAQHGDGYPAPYTFYTDSHGKANTTPVNPTINACGPSANPYNFYPYPCGMTGPGNMGPNGYDFISDTLSITEGDSGGPLWQYKSDGYPYQNSIIVGWEAFFNFNYCGLNFCFRDYGRLIDTGVWNFITTYSNP